MKDLGYFLANYNSITYYKDRDEISFPMIVKADSQIVIKKEMSRERYEIEKCRFYSGFSSLTKLELEYFLSSMEPEIKKNHIERDRMAVV